MRRYVLTYGLIAGAILSVLMVIAMGFHDQIGFDRGMIVGYTTMVAAFLMIFFGVKAYRDNERPGGLSFGRAFATGLLISFVATACYVATWQVVYRTMMPDYLEKYSAYTLEKSREAGASEAELAAEAKKMAEFGEMYKNPLVNIAFTFLEPLPVGLVMSLVTAGVLRRRRALAGSEPAA
jgi:hypothetical protein